MMQQLELILKSEELFAREVALGVIVTRPLKSWLYIIPGMFIVDFLRRQRSLRQYSNCYMIPRRRAVYGAKAVLEGKDFRQVMDHIASELEQDASGAKVADDSMQHQIALIEVLMVHYQKLLAVQGKVYVQLLGNAYPDKDALGSMWSRLNEQERLAGLGIPGYDMDDTLKNQSDAIHRQVATRRIRLIEAVFN